MVLSLLIFVNTSKKGNAVEASYVKVILGCVLLAFLKNCSNLSMPCDHIMKMSSMYL